MWGSLVFVTILSGEMMRRGSGGRNGKGLSCGWTNWGERTGEIARIAQPEGFPTGFSCSRKDETRGHRGTWGCIRSEEKVF